MYQNKTFQDIEFVNIKAAVHCVIIGFSNFDIPNKKLFEYEDIKAEPHKIAVKNILNL